MAVKDNKLKIAHLIMAHTDPEHIARLAKRLIDISDIYIHIDANVDILSFRERLKGIRGVHFISERYHCEWGGYNAILAEIALLKEAVKQNYDRYVFLQGADYPLKSNKKLYAFYENNKDIEFIRGCSCSYTDDKYFYSRSRCIWMFNKKIL